MAPRAKAAGRVDAPIHPPKRMTGNASERVYDELKRQILRGELAVGSVLKEAEISASLGVSRTPVREAFGLLREDGLLEVGPRRQPLVSTIAPERQREVFMLLGILERVAVERASEQMPLEDIDYLRLLLFRQRRAAEAENAEDWIDLDDQFHMAIAAGAQLPILARFLDQLRMLVRLSAVSNARRPHRMQELLEEHEQLVDALEARDGGAAVAILDGHLAGIEKDLLS